MVRFKNRYLLAEILYEKGTAQSLTKSQLLDAIRESVRTNYGDFGHAIVALVLQNGGLKDLCADRAILEFSILSQSMPLPSIPSFSTTCFLLPIIKYHSEETGVCIVRSSRDHFRLVWAAMTFITSIEAVPIMFHIVHVAGTIRSCQKAAIEYNKEWMRVARSWRSEPEADDEGEDDEDDEADRIVAHPLLYGSKLQGNQKGKGKGKERAKAKAKGNDKPSEKDDDAMDIDVDPQS